MKIMQSDIGMHVDPMFFHLPSAIVNEHFCADGGRDRFPESGLISNKMKR
jgi:hypothetical protein